MVLKELRTLIKSGGSLAITLPKSWLDSMGLEAGDNIELEITRDALIIKPLTSKKIKKVKQLKWYEEPSTSINTIIYAYLLGYDIISIEVPRSAEILLEPELTKIKSKLMGLEILESSDGRLVMRMLIDPYELRPVDVLKRMWQLSKESIDRVLLAILENDPQLAESVVQKDEEMDRLYFYIVRVLRSCAEDPVLQAKLELKNANLLDHRVASYLFENINDRTSELATMVIEGLVNNLDKSFLEKLSNVRKILLENHNSVFKVLFNQDISELPKINDRIRNMKLELAFGELTSNELIIHEEISMIARMQYDLAELSWMPASE